MATRCECTNINYTPGLRGSQKKVFASKTIDLLVPDEGSEAYSQQPKVDSLRRLIAES